MYIVCSLIVGADDIQNSDIALVVRHLQIFMVCIFYSIKYGWIRV